MNPTNELAQRGFSLSYICVEKRGKQAPARERKTVEAARAEADTARYASSQEKACVSEKVKSMNVVRPVPTM